MRILIAVLAATAHARVVIPSPSSSETEYRAILEAHPGDTTPSREIRRMRPSSTARERLVVEFATAQKQYLEGGIESARASLERLLSRIPDEDWTQSDRAAFFQSALRRAQIGQDQADTTTWLNLALAIGQGLKPDPTLFPPPLIQQYEKLRDLKPARTVRPNSADGWVQVLVNGVPCVDTNGHGTPIVDSGLPVRVTWLSDKWQPVTDTMTIAQIDRATPPRRPWLEGTCAKARFHNESKIFGEKTGFFDMDCVKTQIEVSRSEKSELNLNPVARYRPVHQGGLESARMFDDSKVSRPLYKSPWLWAGLGTVVAVVVLANQKKQDEKKDPSTTYGY